MNLPELRPWVFRAAIPVALAAPVAVSAFGQLRHHSWWHFAAYVASMVVLAVGMGLVLARYTPFFGRRYMVEARTEREYRSSLRLRAFAAAGHPMVIVVLVALILFGAVVRGLNDPAHNTLMTGERHPREVLDLGIALGYGVVNAVLLGIACAFCFRVRNKELFPPSRLRRWGGRMLKGMGHHSGLLLAVCASLYLVFSVLALTGPWKGVWNAAHTAVLVLLVASVAGITQHEASLCEKCAGRMRLDAAEYAAKRRWRFRVLHSSEWLLAWSPGLIVVTWFLDGAVDLIVTSVVMSVFNGFGALVMFHSKYQPWCPWCNEDGYDVYDCDPSSDKGRPVPA